MQFNKSGFNKGGRLAAVWLMVLLSPLIINGFIVSAQLMPDQRSPINQKNEVLPGSISLQNFTQLDFTSPFTFYLPLILRVPSANDDPTPTPTPQPGPVSCNPSGGSGGFSPGIYETTVGDLLATVVVGEGYDPQKPTYLAFYLHGDEGAYDQFQRKTHPTTRFINEKGWIFVAPKSSRANNEWWSQPDPQVTELASVFQEMFARYNLCQNVILGGTISGGSMFWSGKFFPNKGAQYPAHTLVLCGGWTYNDTETKVKALGNNSHVVAHSSLKFVHGNEVDFMTKEIEDAVRVYTEAGFAITHEVLPGVEHCMDNDSLGIFGRLQVHWTEVISSVVVN